MSTHGGSGGSRSAQSWSLDFGIGVLSLAAALAALAADGGRRALAFVLVLAAVALAVLARKFSATDRRTTMIRRVLSAAAVVALMVAILEALLPSGSSPRAGAPNTPAGTSSDTPTGTAGTSPGTTTSSAPGAAKATITVSRTQGPAAGGFSVDGDGWPEGRLVNVVLERTDGQGTRLYSAYPGTGPLFSTPVDPEQLRAGTQAPAGSGRLTPGTYRVRGETVGGDVFSDWVPYTVTG